MNAEQQPTSQKPHYRFSQASTSAGSFYWVYKYHLGRLLKKMITEVLLILPLYLILFLISWRFRHLIKAMVDVENILNDDDFFGDTVDTAKESIR